MARRWMGVALLAGWLGLSVPVQAQFPPAPPGSPGVDAPPPGAGPGAPPGYGFPPGAGPMPAYPGPEMSPPSPEGPSAPAECLPPNGFSNVHPERVGLVPQFSLEADFLYWWVRRMQVPPLVTTGSLKDALPGALGEPGTGLLIGGTEGPSRQSGGRLSALYWFGQAHEWGVEANAFILTGATSNVGVINGGDPSSSLVLARPFLNPNTGSSDADPIAIPGVQGGALNISMPRRFYGGDLNVRYSECLDVVVWSRITFLGGVRYLNLNEQLLIQEYVTDVPDAFGNPGNLTNLVDNFETRNRFYGGQLGMELESRVGPVVVTLLGKVAVGQTQQQITISGGSSVTEPDGTVTVDNVAACSFSPPTWAASRGTRLAWCPSSR